MKEKTKKILETLLKKIVRQTAILFLKKYKPKIVAITGSAGKTSAKEAIYTVLKKYYRVRRSRGNFNNELGVPLNILGDYSEVKGKIFWIKVLFLSWLRLIFQFKFFGFYPEILILEMAADKPGDIQYLVDIAQPDIGVITAIGNIPVHVENYSGVEGVAKEKGKLVEALSDSGLAILNSDDDLVIKMAEKIKAKTISFGFGEKANIRMDNFEYRFTDKGLPEGISLKIHSDRGFTPMRLNRVLGKPQAYAIGAAVGVGLAFDLNLVEISESLLEYEPPDGRLKMIKGIKKSLVLDDSYNASPIATAAALQTLADLPANRKIAVLGDMRELGDYSKEAHKSIGKLAGEIVDFLICVGPESKFVAETAKKILKEKVLFFDSSEEAKKPIKEMIEEGDLILVKGSHAIGLEKVIEEIKSKSKKEII